MATRAGHHQDLRHLAVGHGLLAVLVVAASVVALTGPVAMTLGILAIALASVAATLPSWRRVLAPGLQAGPDVSARDVLGQPGQPDPPDSPTPDEVERRRRIQAVINAGDSLSIVFQPVIDLTSNRPVGWEALSRFAGDDRSPLVWFQEANAVGLAVELELLAVTRALEAAPESEYLSVNVGPATLVDDRFRLLLETGRRGPIVVELTEHAVIEDYAVVADAVEHLHRMGVRIAVDDAGSGFSSLRHVISLAPDIIKLDQALIASIDRDPRRRMLAISLATFASEIGSELIAEGIEREEELHVCEEIGIRYGQGYLLGRPGRIGSDTRLADRED